MSEGRIIWAKIHKPFLASCVFGGFTTKACHSHSFNCKRKKSSLLTFIHINIRCKAKSKLNNLHALTITTPGHPHSLYWDLRVLTVAQCCFMTASGGPSASNRPCRMRPTYTTGKRKKREVLFLKRVT